MLNDEASRSSAAGATIGSTDLLEIPLILRLLFKASQHICILIIAAFMEVTQFFLFQDSPECFTVLI